MHFKLSNILHKHVLFLKNHLRREKYYQSGFWHYWQYCSSNNLELNILVLNQLNFISKDASDMTQYSTSPPCTGSPVARPHGQSFRGFFNIKLF